MCGVRIAIFQYYTGFANLDMALMRDAATLTIHLLVTIAHLLGPGGVRSIVAESLLVKHQLLILNRS